MMLPGHDLEVRFWSPNDFSGNGNHCSLQNGATYSTDVPPVTNNAPSVSLTHPLNNTSIAAGANIVVDATASDSDGSVTKVDFYQGTMLLGTDTSSPYTFVWTNVPAGAYSLTAKATDERYYYLQLSRGNCDSRWWLSLIVASSAKEWQGLIPSVSTRADVVRLLGYCQDRNSLCEFDFKGDRIRVVLSTAISRCASFGTGTTPPGPQPTSTIARSTCSTMPMAGC